MHCNLFPKLLYWIFGESGSGYVAHIASGSAQFNTPCHIYRLGLKAGTLCVIWVA